MESSSDVYQHFAASALVKSLRIRNLGYSDKRTKLCLSWKRPLFRRSAITRSSCCQSRDCRSISSNIFAKVKFVRFSKEGITVNLTFDSGDFLEDLGKLRGWDIEEEKPKNRHLSPRGRIVLRILYTYQNREESSSDKPHFYQERILKFRATSHIEGVSIPSTTASLYRWENRTPRTKDTRVQILRFLAVNHKEQAGLHFTRLQHKRGKMATPQASFTNSRRASKNSLGPFDVVFGRGTGPNEHVGNIRYRALVSNVIEEVTLHELKTKGGLKAFLARQVVEKVQKNGGLFLRRISKLSRPYGSTPDSSGTGIQSGKYEEVPYEKAIDKTKQNFRHQLRILELKTTTENNAEKTRASGSRSKEAIHEKSVTRGANPETSFLERAIAPRYPSIDSSHATKRQSNLKYDDISRLLRLKASMPAMLQPRGVDAGTIFALSAAVSASKAKFPPSLLPSSTGTTTSTSFFAPSSLAGVLMETQTRRIQTLLAQEAIRTTIGTTGTRMGATSEDLLQQLHRHHVLQRGRGDDDARPGHLHKKI